MFYSQKESSNDVKYSQKEFKSRELFCFNKLAVCSKYFFKANENKEKHLMMVILFIMREIHGRMIQKLKTFTDISAYKLSIFESIQLNKLDYIHQHEKYFDAMMYNTPISIPTLNHYRPIIYKYYDIITDNSFEQYKHLVNAIGGNDSASATSAAYKRLSESSSLPSNHQPTQPEHLFNKLHMHKEYNHLYKDGDYKKMANVVQSLKQSGGATKSTLVLFYVTYCPFSKPVVERFKEMKKNKNDYNFNIEMINCDNSPDLKAIYKFQTYPTIRYKYNNNVDDQIDFSTMFDEHNRTIKNMVTFVDRCASPSQTLKNVSKHLD